MGTRRPARPFSGAAFWIVLVCMVAVIGWLDAGLARARAARTLGKPAADCDSPAAAPVAVPAPPPGIAGDFASCGDAAPPAREAR